MPGECHAHFFMNGTDYRQAVELHREQPSEAWIRTLFQEYRDRGVSFIRDGGDHYGVSLLAKQLAPEYEIDYRTPVFAIHRKGHYGKVVGRAYSDLREYAALVREAAAAGADFIKIMTAGIMDFQTDTGLTGEPLPLPEVKELVHIAHEEGFAVMSHTNGADSVKIAVEAGVDSLEHGNFQNRSSLTELADAETVWVPTLVTVKNLIGCGRFSDAVLNRIWEKNRHALSDGVRLGVRLAAGSDAGAFQVRHGEGICQEEAAIRQILSDPEQEAPLTDREISDKIEAGERQIRARFRRKR